MGGSHVSTKTHKVAVPTKNSVSHLHLFLDKENLGDHKSTRGYIFFIVLLNTTTVSSLWIALHILQRNF
jgi:hypothetical protein